MNESYTIDELMELYAEWHKNEHKESMVPCDVFCGVPYFLAWLGETKASVFSKNAEKTGGAK